jgi:hypothetical protein
VILIAQNPERTTHGRFARSSLQFLLSRRPTIVDNDDLAGSIGLRWDALDSARHFFRAIVSGNDDGDLRIHKN